MLNVWCYICGGLLNSRDEYGNERWKFMNDFRDIDPELLDPPDPSIELHDSQTLSESEVE